MMSEKPSLLKSVQSIEVPAKSPAILVIRNPEYVAAFPKVISARPLDPRMR
jgi:hypothetical protein